MYIWYTEAHAILTYASIPLINCNKFLLGPTLITSIISVCLLKAVKASVSIMFVASVTTPD